MNTGHMRFFSEALGRHVWFAFRLPDPSTAGPGPYPALLQLHGRRDDYNAWFTRSKLLVYLDALPFVVITPDGAISYWGNRGPRERYEDFVIQDLMPACKGFFPIRDGRWAIGGLSMGGFGAMRLGLKYPNLFASIHAHSSVVHDRAGVAEAFGDLPENERADFDLQEISSRAVKVPDRPRLSFDCGTEDSLLSHNQRFHKHLDELGYPHEYREYPGGHTWEYWDTHVPEALKQHAEVLLP